MMADHRRRIHALSKILLDRTAPLSDRDDAAIDLACFDDQEAFQALLQIATDPSENEMLLASCGESIAEIWVRSGQFDPEVFEKLTGVARSEAQAVLARTRSDWLSPIPG